MLNIGSGNWECDGWTNLDYPSEWYAQAQQKHKFTPYDMRRDNIPFADNTVEAIYCCQVIEHIENEHVFAFFQECFRVLKKGGVLRIVCPDAEFLYLVSRLDTSWWEWRRGWFDSPRYYKGNPPRTVDFLVREIATPLCLGYVNGINHEDYEMAFTSLNMIDFFEYLTANLVWRETAPGDHINYWTFDKVQRMLHSAEFERVICSKQGSSVCSEMRNTWKFDNNYTIQNLYVDVVK